MPLLEKFPGDAHASAEGASRNFGVPPPFRPLLRPWRHSPSIADARVSNLLVFDRVKEGDIGPWKLPVIQKKKKYKFEGSEWASRASRKEL